MPDIRLQTDMPDKASEILFEALDLQKSKLQFSLNLARKRLEKFENKYGVTFSQFMNKQRDLRKPKSRLTTFQVSLALTADIKGPK